MLKNKINWKFIDFLFKRKRLQLASHIDQIYIYTSIFETSIIIYKRVFSLEIHGENVVKAFFLQFTPKIYHQTNPKGNTR